jgi:predicted glycosyltransferase
MMAQKRVLFFVYDGGGIGHLTRLSKIAGHIQGPCASLVVTGHRSASWIVPEHCEFIHLPSLDSLFSSRASYWGREPFLSTTKSDALGLRAGILSAIVEHFRPDAIFLDYLPCGKFDEMRKVLEEHPARKYFVLRGVLDRPEVVRAEIFDPASLPLLDRVYERIFVTCDERVIDLSEEYGLTEAVSRKLAYVGYVVNPVSGEALSVARAARGLDPRRPWIVCSTGSGKYKERLLRGCEEVALSHPAAFWDIVAGPKARPGESTPGAGSTGHIAYHREVQELPLWNAACDLTICHGGYNTLMEAISGRTPVVVWPGPDFEQSAHAERLSRHYPIRLIHNTEGLRAQVKLVARKESSPSEPLPLNTGGLDNIRALLFQDLEITLGLC